MFKLEEIQRSDRLLRPGMTVVDLGAAPGGWSQYAARLLEGKGRIIAMDILDMPAHPGRRVPAGRFQRRGRAGAAHWRCVGQAKVDLVLSDMAPNMMGIADVDHDRSMQLVELAVDFAGRTLTTGRRFPRQGLPGPRFPAAGQAVARQL